MGTVATVLMLAAALATENELHVLLLLHKDHACSLSGSVYPCQRLCSQQKETCSQYSLEWVTQHLRRKFCSECVPKGFICRRNQPPSHSGSKSKV